MENVEVPWRWEVEGEYIMSPFLLRDEKVQKMMALLLNRVLIWSGLRGSYP